MYVLEGTGANPLTATWTEDVQAPSAATDRADATFCAR
jgi:hypothetical protein